MASNVAIGTVISEQFDVSAFSRVRFSQLEDIILRCVSTGLLFLAIGLSPIGRPALAEHGDKSPIFYFDVESTVERRLPVDLISLDIQFEIEADSVLGVVERMNARRDEVLTLVGKDKLLARDGGLIQLELRPFASIGPIDNGEPETPVAYIHIEAFRASARFKYNILSPRDIVEKLRNIKDIEISNIRVVSKSSNNTDHFLNNMKVQALHKAVARAKTIASVGGREIGEPAGVHYVIIKEVVSVEASSTYEKLQVTAYAYFEREVPLCGPPDCYDGTRF